MDLVKVRSLSFRITRNVRVFWKHNGYKEEEIDVSGIIDKYKGAKVYCLRNSTVAFIECGVMYVTPYTRNVVNSLRKHNFSSEMFYVPFSNGELPVADSVGWLRLKSMAKAENKKVFEEDCTRWCDEQGILNLDDGTLDRCVKLPLRDVEEFDSDTMEKMTFFINDMSFNINTVDRLGLYCKDKDSIAFIYRDGHTYITNDMSVEEKLVKNGFREW